MPYAKLTQTFVDSAKAKAKPGAERTIWWDKGMEGFGLQVTASGAQSFVFQYRMGDVSRRMKLDGKFLRLEAEREAKNGAGTKHEQDRETAPSPIDNAKAEAIAVKNAINTGRDPLAECRKKAAAASSTLQAIAEDYMKREGKKLRSSNERERILKKYVYPKLGSRQIDDIRRKNVTDLLDGIEDTGGPVMADHVLAVLRKIFNWHAARVDEFKSPLVKGMTRAAPAKERARKRIFSDAELRAFWRAAEAFPGVFGYLLRFILLTATRRAEAAEMPRAEVSYVSDSDVAPGDVWTISAARHKSKNDFELPLSKAAAELLAVVPKINEKIKGNPGWVFTHDGMRAIGGFSKFKAAFDKKMLAELRKIDKKATLPSWVIHDVRRTARSLMSRAGVLPRPAEIALGHLVAGVEGVYDRHRYLDEKRSAFEALAQQVDRILNPQDNVIPMRA